MELEHSRLLRFITEGRRPTMADTPIIKIQKDYENPPNVSSEVPGEQTIREGTSQDDNVTSEIQITETEFTLSPVITVTKKETALTKGDMKLQKVTVTEDIAANEAENGEWRISHTEYQNSEQTVTQQSRTAVTSERRERTARKGKMEKEDKSPDEKKSKIPITRLRQAVEMVKKERQAQKAKEQPRRSSIPKLKVAKMAVKKETLIPDPKAEEEFEKIYEAIVDSPQIEIDDKILAVKIEDTEKVDSKFEEIIHAYDENAREKQTVSKVSKIPALRRREDDRPSRIGALVDRAKAKNTASDTKLKDGGFRVTASNIKTKRFSRGNSRDLSKDDSKVDITESIDINESGDCEVAVREIVKQIPLKPERSIRRVSREINRDGHKVHIVETIQDVEFGGQRIIKESIGESSPLKTHSLLRGMEVSKDAKNVNVIEKFDEKGNCETVTIEEIKDGDSHNIITKTTVKENIIVTPVKTERIIRGISREINKNTQEFIIEKNCDIANSDNSETVTVEEFQDGGRTVTTKTTVRETVKVGTPVITETIINNIGREITTAGQNTDIIESKGKANNETVAIKDTKDEDRKKIVKETIVRENIKIGIPVKTERFTRGISREMGNMKQRLSKEIITKEEVKDDSSQGVLKKTVTKENVKVGIPVKSQRVEYNISREIKDDDTEKNKEITKEITKEDSQNIIKETLKKETIEEGASSQSDVKYNNTIIMNDGNKEIINNEKFDKEGIKRIPVFTKVTNSFSKGKIQTVEMSKTIEWKSADEVRTKHYARSVSEKVTKKELKDVNTIPTAKDTIIKDNSTEHMLKERQTTTQNISTKLIKRSVTEYQTDEQETNIEKKTFSLNKSLDSVKRDSKELNMDTIYTVSRGINKQKSLVDSQDIRETDLKLVSKENSIDAIRETTTTDSVSEKKETVNSYLPVQEKDSNTEVVTILKGNVSRLKNKIYTKENVDVSKKETDDDLPKNKSILSKIAIFERLEPNEGYPTIKKNSSEKKPSKLVTTKINIEDKVKIVDHILKDQPKLDSNYDINNVQVVNRNEPVIVEEFWKSTGEYQNNSAVNQIITDKGTGLEIRESRVKIGQNVQEKDFHIDKILPVSINFTTSEYKIDFAKDDKILPEETELSSDENQFKIAKPLQGKFNSHEKSSTEIDFDNKVGKSKPGKINLNIWKNQVQVNKTLVDKTEIVRSENLDEVAKTFPGKVDFKPSKCQIQVSKVIPGKIDITKEAIQLETTEIYPDKDFNSKEIQLDSITALPGETIFKVDDTLNKVGTLPNEHDIKVHDNRIELGKDFPGKTDKNQVIITHLPGQIDFSTDTNNIVLPKILPDKKEYLRPRSISIQTSENKVEIAKQIPGKINLNLWKNEVEMNKIYVGKLGNIKKTENTKTSPVKTEYKTNDNQVEVTKSLEGQNHFFKQNKIKVESVKTLSEKLDSSSSAAGIEVIATETEVEEFKTLPSEINFTSEAQIEMIKTLPATIDITSRTQVEAISTLPAIINNITDSQDKLIWNPPEEINLITTDPETQSITTLPGRIDWNITKIQIEEVKTLPDKIGTSVDSQTLDSKEHSYVSQNKMLPVTIDFKTCESKVDANKDSDENQANTFPGKINLERDIKLIDGVKSLPGKLDLKAWENQVEVNKTLVGTISNKTEEKSIEFIRPLRSNIDFITYENHETSKILRTNTDFTAGENNSQTVLEESNIEDNKNLIEAINTLPGNVEFEASVNKIPLNPFFVGFNTRVNKGGINETTQEESDLHSKKDNVVIYSDLEPRESLRDPELVDEPEIEVNQNKDSIIGEIKKKMYFITNNNLIQNFANKPISSEIPVGNNFDKESDSEREAEELRSLEDYIEDKTTVNNNFNLEVTKYNITNNHFDEDHMKTNENKFYSGAKVQSEMIKSDYGTEEYKSTREDIKRAKSLAELDLGDVVNGQVRRMVGRIKSVDFDRKIEHKVEKISIKEMPKKMSVLEKIALFEGKTSKTKLETSTYKAKVTKQNVSQVIPDEVYLQKIEDLTTAKIKLGRLNNMLYLPLANGGEMPVIALGTALMDPRLTPYLIGAAIDLGYRAFDTAFIYGNEKEVGLAIKAKIDDGTVRREDLFIISKLWSTYHRSDLVEEACRSSLNALGLDYFDLYLIHNPMSFKEGPDPIPRIATVLQYSDHDYLDAWYGMETVHANGLARSIGVSNFNTQQIQKILDKGKVKPVVNQVECHPYLSQQRMHEYCIQRNITLSCFGVLGSKGTPAEFKNPVTPVIDDAMVQLMASGLGVSPAQLLIRYQIENGHSVVVKASSAAHLWDNLQALTFTLNRTQIDGLHALNRNKRIFTFRGMGDTHRNYPFQAGF